MKGRRTTNTLALWVPTHPAGKTTGDFMWNVVSVNNLARRSWLAEMPWIRSGPVVRTRLPPLWTNTVSSPRVDTGQSTQYSCRTQKAIGRWNADPKITPFALVPMGSSGPAETGPTSSACELAGQVALDSCARTHWAPAVEGAPPKLVTAPRMADADCSTASDPCSTA